MSEPTCGDRGTKAPEIASLETIVTGWPSPDREIATALHVFLPFVRAFLASRLVYGWIKKAGRQFCWLFADRSLDFNDASSRLRLLHRFNSVFHCRQRNGYVHYHR